MSDLLIGLDVGTTATKALLLDMEGHVVASATRGYGLITGPGQGWVEQDAEELWQAVVETLRAVTSRCGPGQRIVAVSQSSEGGTTIPVDAGGRPTYHALSWMDQWAVQELTEVSREAGAESIRQTTGWPLGPGLPRLHIRWLKQHCPAEFAATHRFLFVNDFIGQRLTGQPCMDPLNTSITHSMVLATGDWDARLLGFAGIRRDRLSPLQPSGTVIGSLHRAASEATSLPIGTLAINGAHDQYCAAVATGVTMPGRLLLSCGTAWLTLAVAPDLPTGLRSGLVISRHAVAGCWEAIVSLGAVGTFLEWLADSVWDGRATDERTALYQSLDEEAAHSQPGAAGLLFFLLADTNHG